MVGLETSFFGMADDLASFIESQKRKLERERTEILHAQESEVTCKLIEAI